MDDLDRILNMRQAVPPRVGLEERILMMTQPSVMAFIMLPRPILMMLILLICGLGLGLYGDEFTNFEAIDYAGLLLDEDEALGGLI